MTDEITPLSSPPSSAPIPTAAPLPPAAPGGPASRWLVTLVLASMLGTLLFVAGYLAAGASPANGSCAAPAPAFAALCEAYDALKQQYVDKLDDTQLAEGAIKGLFEYGVKDPFSAYMAPDEYQRALGSLSGKFIGIGAEMSVKNIVDPTKLDACATLSDACVLVVVAPLVDSPAEKAGLQAGDIITAVDGVGVNGSKIGRASCRERV